MLALVPARGGSKSIPGKNLRALNGKPLLLHTLDLLRQVPELSAVYVSTDNRDIAEFAKLHGFQVIDRPDELAHDDTPVAAVAVHAVQTLGWDGPVGVFQPTSPTLTVDTIRNAYYLLDGYRSLASVRRLGKLCWGPDGPLYTSRTNRQYLDTQWVETGGIQLAQQVPAGHDPLIGTPHRLYHVPDNESYDIDTPDDFETARRHLARAHIELVVLGATDTGTGHVRRALTLARELAHDTRITFADRPAGWALDLVGEQEPFDNPPDLTIFDRLDTNIEDVAECRAVGQKVVCLEDLGPGSDIADLVINELYDDRRPGVLAGPKYAVLRPEFLACPPFRVRDRAKRIVVSFGGTDPAGLTNRVARLAQVTGCDINVVRPGDQTLMATTFHQADLLVTSAGRTVHEAAAVGIPTVSIAANARESRHSHCDGIVRLGLHATLSDDTIRDCLSRIVDSPALRHEMSVTARAQVDGLGTRRIVHAIDALIEGL